MKFTKTLSIIGCIAASICSPAFAQEAETTPVTEAATTAVETAATEATATVATTQDGSLSGKVFTEAEGVKTPLNAKVTLSSDGVVVDSVEAEEDGTFSFAGVEPGSYQLFGAADGYVGGQAFDVQPYASEVIGGSGCSSCDLGLQAVEQPCSSCSQSLYQAPASACGCSGGGGGGLLGGGGGLLGGGGGLFGGSRLLALGAVGGIVAIAVSDDDDDDMVSPDN